MSLYNLDLAWQLNISQIIKRIERKNESGNSTIAKVKKAENLIREKTRRDALRTSEGVWSIELALDSIELLSPMT